MSVLIMIVAGCLVLFGCWRLFLLSSGGCRVVVRHVPADGDHGWRHGTIRFESQHLKFYKLRSALPTADKIVDRHDVDIRARRDLTASEKSFMGENARVLSLRCGQCNYEVAMDNRTETALTSWLESAPSPLLDRVNTGESVRTRLRGNRS